MSKEKILPFVYSVTFRYGSFAWDGSNGVACYLLPSGKLVHHDIFPSIRYQDSKVPDYYVFEEDAKAKDETGRSRVWLFEVKPRDNETHCFISYFHLDDKPDSHPTPYGAADLKENMAMVPDIQTLTAALNPAALKAVARTKKEKT